MISQSKYLKIIQDSERKIMSFVWQDKDASMDAGRFIKEIELSSRLIKKYKPDFILVDTRGLLLEMTEELQHITNDYILDAYHEAEVRKVAMILPLQTIYKLYMEETVNLRKSLHKFEIRNFTDPEEANKWLFNE